MNRKKIIIEEYSEVWPILFNNLHNVFKKTLGSLIVDIQHVGSTSVPGLAAKPTIDIDLVIKNKELLNFVIERLEDLGYEYLGDLGIKDREAFRRKSDKTPIDGSGKIWPNHNLYCCTQNSLSFKNHISFRDFLRKNPEKLKQYSELKKSLAFEHPFESDYYTEQKTPFITEILKETGFSPEELVEITAQNKSQNR